MRWIVVLALVLLTSLSAVAAEDPADSAEPAEVTAPAGDVIRVENGLLTVRAMNIPLARLLADIATQVGATMRGNPPERVGSYDFHDVPLGDALKRIMGSDSFMLTYGTEGQVRAIRFLGRGEAVILPSPGVTPTGQPAPLAAEEQQAGVLQRQVVVTDHPPLRRALQTTTPTIGQVLHATTMEANPNARAGAREVALATFTSAPDVEAAYLSTLEPVSDATLATMLRSSSSPGAAEEWMQLLSTRAPSPALRAKAAAVLKALR